MYIRVHTPQQQLLLCIAMLRAHLETPACTSDSITASTTLYRVALPRSSGTRRQIRRKKSTYVHD